MLLNGIGAGFYCTDPSRPDPKYETTIVSSRIYCRRGFPARLAAVHWESKSDKRRSICTADELHRVSVSNSDWKLALWRYLPSPQVSLSSQVLNFSFSLNTLLTIQWYIFWVSYNFTALIEKEMKKIFT